MMTHKQRQAMFLEIAEAYDTPPEERAERQLSLTRSGICSAVNVSTRRDLDSISREAAYLYRELFRAYGYLWPFNRRGDNYRATLCCLFASMTEAEYLALAGEE